MDSSSPSTRASAINRYELTPNDSSNLKYINRGQPLRDMWADFRSTFTPYKPKNYQQKLHINPWQDLMQIFRGIKNCVFSVECFVLALLTLFFTVTLIAPIAYAYKLRSVQPIWKSLISWPQSIAQYFWMGLQFAIRGTTQIASYALGLVFLKMAVRGVITWWQINKNKRPPNAFLELFRGLTSTFKPYNKASDALLKDILIIKEGIQHTSRALLAFTVFLSSFIASSTIIIPLMMFVYLAVKNHDLKRGFKEGLMFFPKTALLALKLALAEGLLGITQTISYLAGLVFVRMALRSAHTLWDRQNYISKDKRIAFSALMHDIAKDVRDTFKPYKSAFYIKRDALQWLAGIQNCAIGLKQLTIFVLSLTATATLLIPIGIFIYTAFQRHNLKEAWEKVAKIPEAIFPALGYGLAYLTRGVSQIVSYPFIVLPRIFLRGFITLKQGGYQSLEKNSDIKTLATRLIELIKEQRPILSNEVNKFSVVFPDQKIHVWNIPEKQTNPTDVKQEMSDSTYEFLIKYALLEAKVKRYREKGQSVNEIIKSPQDETQNILPHDAQAGAPTSLIYAKAEIKLASIKPTECASMEEIEEQLNKFIRTPTL